MKPLDFVAGIGYFRLAVRRFPSLGACSAGHGPPYETTNKRAMIGEFKMLSMLVLAVIVLLEIFWIVQLADLMAKSDDEFPGRFDKPTWAAILLLTNVIGAFAYWLAKPEKESPRVEATAPIREYPEPCIKCGQIIPVGIATCPSCGWSYQGDAGNA